MDQPPPSPDGAAGERRIPVVMNANARFLPGLLVTGHSLLRRLSPDWTADFTLLTDDFCEEDERVLRRVLAATGRPHTLEVRRVSTEDFRDCPAMNTGSRLAYARLLIPRLLTVPRALYIDADIVVRRDVSELVALPWQEDRVVHAVRDCRTATCGSEGLPCAELGIPPETHYFNSGLLWIDLESWRRHGVEEACWEYVRRFPDRMPYYDQSVLNAVLWNRWTPMDRPWNVFFEQTLGRFAVYPWRRVRGANVHYVNVKPWIARSPFDFYFREQMREIAALVPPQTAALPSWTRAMAREWANFLAMRVVYHYGGFLKHTVRKWRRQASGDTARE